MQENSSLNKLEADIIRAAKALRSRFWEEIELLKTYESAKRKREDLLPKLKLVEKELLDAELQLAAARQNLNRFLTMQEADDFVKEKRLEKMEEARRVLWRSAFQMREAELLKAAHELALCTEEFHQSSQSPGYKSKISEAEEAVKLAEARTTAARNTFEDLQSKLKELETSMSESRSKASQQQILFTLERNLVNSACRLNGSDKREIAFDCLEIDELFYEIEWIKNLKNQF